MKLKTASALLICLLLPFLNLIAQETIVRRPKLGLVLSGGAAKGMAHVGVLKVLEEAGIRPDYITGTSMGSIIGGLYAMGYSADTLEQLIREQDWNKVLSDKIPLNEVIFEEKPFFENHLIEFPFQGWKIKTPSGLIYGQQIAKLLTQLTLPAQHINDFHQLPVPYACIGADIIRGQSIVLQEGSLPDAMRASMAIPTIFTPITKDSFLLVDGGLIHNFPVAEAVDMGADIIIGVYTGARRADVDKLNSFTGIVSQSVFLMGIQDAEMQIPLCDIYIEPDLEGYNAQDFNKADSIMMRGERAARQQLEALRRLAAYIRHFDTIEPIRQLPPLYAFRVDRIEVMGNQQISGLEITGRFGIAPGRFVTPQELDRGINNIYGTNYFERVNYRLRKEGDLNVIVIQCHEKPAITLKTAVSYDSYSEAGFLANITLRNFLMPASRLLATARVTENYRFLLSFLKYIDPAQEWSLFTSFQINRDEVPIIRKGIKTEEFSLINLPFDLGLQKRLGKNAMIGLGWQYELLRFKPLSGSELAFNRLTYRNFNLYGFYQLNTLDKNILPTEGSTLFLQLKYLSNNRFDVLNFNPTTPISTDSVFAFEPYGKFTLYSKHWIKLHHLASLTISPFIGITWNPSNTFGDFFLVGAPDALNGRAIPFHGLNSNELVAQTIFGADIGYQHFAKKNLLLTFNVNSAFLKSPQVLSDVFPRNDYNAMVGGSIGIAFNSVVGPVKIALMYPFYAEGDIRQRVRTFISIGHRF